VARDAPGAGVEVILPGVIIMASRIKAKTVMVISVIIFIKNISS